MTGAFLLFRFFSHMYCAVEEQGYAVKAYSISGDRYKQYLVFVMMNLYGSREPNIPLVNVEW